MAIQTLVIGEPGLVEGKVGRGLSLDHSGDGIGGKQRVPPLDGDVTLETWLRTADREGLGELIHWSLAGLGPLQVTLDEGRPAVRLGEDSEKKSDAVVSDGRWHHLAVVISRADTNGVQVLVDGDLVPLTAAGKGMATRQEVAFLIGGRGDRAFIGTLDEFSIHDRALRRSEVVGIWAVGREGKCSE